MRGFFQPEMESTLERFLYDRLLPNLQSRRGKVGVRQFRYSERRLVIFWPKIACKTWRSETVFWKVVVRKLQQGCFPGSRGLAAGVLDNDTRDGAEAAYLHKLGEFG